jgi:aspartate/methionine/tyrosine aminotransferase
MRSSHRFGDLPLPRVNPLVAAVEVPPIPAAHAWASRYDGRHGPLLDLCQAVPGYAPHPDLLARAAAAASDPANARYGLINGDLVLREAYAAELSASYGGAVGPDQVAITAGCNQAFFLALTTLAERGDNVLLPLPWFWNHQQSCTMLGIEPRPLPCRAEAGFVPDPDDAARLIDGRTRAIVLITPNNPTGAVYPPEVIASFHRLCATHDIPLILDETYRDFLPAGQARSHELFTAPDWPAHLIQLYSFSKAYCIPGHRLGAIAAEAGLIGAFMKVLDCLHICPQRGGQAALGWAIPALGGWRAANRDLINRRAEAVRDGFQRLSGWRVESLGAYFAYVRHPFGGVAAASVAERVATEFGAVGLPGSAFGPGQDGHLRMAFANVGADGIGDVVRRLALMTA